MTPNFSKSKKDITNLISVHDSIILFYFHLVHCSFILGHGWLHSNQLFFCKILQFSPSSWRCLRCVMEFAGDFTTIKQQFMHPHCIVLYDKTWKKTVLTCITKIIAEQPFLTQYERPMYHNESTINMLSSTDNNFMIILFDFERFRIEFRFPFLPHTVYSLARWSCELATQVVKAKRNSLQLMIMNFNNKE